MTKRVSDLTKEELNYLVAKARGWVEQDGSPWFNEPQNQLIYVDSNKAFKCSVDGYHPSTNGGQAMELVEEYKISVAWSCSGKPWDAAIEDQSNSPMLLWAKGNTPMEAICRAVIASHYGDEVPDDE